MIEPPPPEPAVTGADLPSVPLPSSRVPAELAPLLGIDWKSFLRTAVPLAALTDVLTMILHPLAFFLLLPANLVWAISLYRRRHPIALRPGQGARMGALMGLLSFAFFLAFFLITISFQHAQYRDLMVTRIHEIAAQNPDPQAQQMLQWFATPDGLIAFTAIALVTILLICLAVGTSSGAVAVMLGKDRKRL